MRYGRVVPGTFLDRPNRFIAHVQLDGQTETVHVKNTGRCRELLVPGCRVYLSVSDNPARKTKYDLIAVEKHRPDGTVWHINMDSQAPNDAAAEWLPRSGLFSDSAVIRREVTHKGSRFDFYIEDGDKKAFLEVKGCTLEDDGRAMFPDAPTERGVKHLRELTACVGEGYEAYVLIVIQMKGVTFFSPNDKTDPAFGEAMRQAASGGVRVLAMDCRIEPDGMVIDAPVAVDLTDRRDKQ